MLNSPSELRDLARRMENGDVRPAETIRRCGSCSDACAAEAAGITDHEWLICIDALRVAAAQRDREINDARTLADLLG